MPYRSLELRVGVTIFFGALILAIGLMWFQGFQLGRTTYELQATFPMVGGIDPGDEVNVNGVERGEVKQVILRERDVLIRLTIDADVQVPVDSRVVLQSIGIMGERVVTIRLGESDRYLEPGAVLDGVYDPGISEALASLGKVMDNLQGLMEDLQQITDALIEGGNLKEAVGDLTVVARELRETITATTPELEEGVSAFNNSAKRFDKMLADNAGRLDSIMVSVEQASGDLPELIERVSEVTDALTKVARRLESGDNTIGALLEDRELLDRLEQAINNLDLLITDVRANPKKYLKVSVF
jgi:phospholipid/cholesterol/gamma-HCH transport system substrate-binding protein